jgi:hypothetical protein
VIETPETLLQGSRSSSRLKSTAFWGDELAAVYRGLTVLAFAEATFSF